MAFYEPVLAAGATSLLAPAVHPEYHADYYYDGAFVLEAVCHH